MAFLELGKDYKEWTDKDTGLLMWKLTKKGKEKVQVFQDQAQLWHDWLGTIEHTDENLVNPWSMGVND
jgi:hypothetical protein